MLAWFSPCGHRGVGIQLFIFTGENMNKHDTPNFIIRFYLILLIGVFATPVFSATVSEVEPSLIFNVETAISIQKTVHQRKVSSPAVEVYNKLFNALENNAYFVIHEPDTGKTLARFSQRWGKDYNKNGIKYYRSIVFCNAEYANTITNADPTMALICPQHVTIIQIKNITKILYALPGVTAQNSKAVSVINTMEEEIIQIIDEAVN